MKGMCTGQIKQVACLNPFAPRMAKTGVLAILSAKRLDACLVQVGLYFAHTYSMDKIILAAASSMYGFDRYVLHH